MTQMVVLELQTLLGARYVFPDVDKGELDQVVQHASRGEHCASLTVRNISHAVLVVPWRIISEISYGGEVQWKRQSSGA